MSTIFGYLQTKPHVLRDNTILRTLERINSTEQAFMLGYVHWSQYGMRDYHDIHETTHRVSDLSVGAHTVLVQHTAPAIDNVIYTYPLTNVRYTLGLAGKILGWEDHRMVRPYPLREVEDQGAVLLGYLDHFGYHNLVTVEAIQQIIQGLGGWYACWLLDRKFSRLYLWRIRAPLYRYEEHGGVYFTTTQNTNFLLHTPVQTGHIMSWEFRKTHWVALETAYFEEL